MTLRAVATLLAVTLAGTAVSAWSAEPAVPGVRAAALNVPAAGGTGFTLLRPEQTGLTFTNTLDDWASAS